MTVSAAVVVLVAIIAAAAFVALAAAIHRVYSQQGQGQGQQDNFIPQASNDQVHYMRDVRMRTQTAAFGRAPRFEGLNNDNDNNYNNNYNNYAAQQPLTGAPYSSTGPHSQYDDRSSYMV